MHEIHSKPLVIKRTLPEEFRRALVILHYGSASDFSRIAYSYAELGRIFNISPRTVEKVIKAFKAHDGDLGTFRD